MKRMILITALTLSTTVSAFAGQQNSIGALIIGAGGGAAMGQAIGRDTESTLIGTAVGSVVGYIIGNEMDKDQRIFHRPVQQRSVQYHSRPVVHKQKHVAQYNYYHETVNRTSPPPPRRHCKEAEILGTVNGKAKKMYGTVCRTPQGWELVSDESYHDNKNRHNPHGRDHKYKRNSHYRNFDDQNWARHRF